MYPNEESKNEFNVYNNKMFLVVNNSLEKH